MNNNEMMERIKHNWSFSSVGGVKRVNLESGDDLLHLEELDQKLWTALSCPVNDLEIDASTLKLMDKDGDEQIRVPEILEAVKWVCSVLNQPNDLLSASERMPLSAINTNTPEGKTLYSSAKIILKSLGKENIDFLTVEDTSDTQKIFANSKFSGDGIITEDTVDSNDLKLQLQQIITCVGSKYDRSGKEGIDQENLEKFKTACADYLGWYEQQHINASILALGENTAVGYESYCKVKSKINDYFIRCRIASYDSDATNALNLSAARVEAITSKDLSGALQDVAEYPLSKIVASKTLSLNEGLNPAWEADINTFRKLVIEHFFPSSSTLSINEWEKIESAFEPYQNWLAAKAGHEVEILGVDKIKSILSQNAFDTLSQLIVEDLKLESEANSIILVDQLVRYHRDLFTLLKNFVTFHDFYSPHHKAIFQAGTLYIDQRSCELCIKVHDMPKHNTMVSFSGMFLMYCECKSRSSNESMTIVAALTNGDIDNLVVGRNALFYDREGKDWDATVIKIVDNPISIRQAFWSPYRKVSRFIETQINKFASAQDEKVTADATGKIEALPGKIEAIAAPKAPAPPFDVGKFVGIFAAIGLALGAIGTALASVVAGFMGLVWWKMPFAIAGILLLISGPSMIIAYLKLRKRNLAPILDANGWAINARAIVNIQFGNTLTQLADLPKGAKINLNDPFTQKKRPFLPYILFASILLGVILYFLWKLGYIHINHSF
jgi:hypothetical protein